MTRRHIQRLRLRAPAEPLIRRGELLVEDAMHTASLPDQRRLLLIRSLNLGKIHPAGSAATLALRVEARVAALGPALRYAGEPGAAGAPAVFFHDEHEPYALLALRMLRGQAATEWFWPLALAGWRTNTPPAPAAAVRLTLELAARHGPAAGVALLGALRRQGQLPALLDALVIHDGPPLLGAFSWPDSSDLVAPSAPAALAPPGWPVARWVARWGVQEPLSCWLAAAALAEAQPARLADPARLMWQARALIRHCPVEAATPARDSRQLASATLPPAAPAPAGAPIGLYPVDAPALATPDPHALPFDTRPPARQTSALAAVGHPPPAPAAGNAVAAGHGELSWSAAAGVFLVLPILARLGLTELLQACPELLDCAFAERLLHELADHSGVGQDDAARQALPIPADALAPPRDIAFAIPAWRALAQGPLQVCRMDGGWVLRDESGDLVLAAWRRRAPPQICLVMRERPIGRGPAVQLDGRGVWGVLLGAWQVALDRWARRYVALDLRALIERTGTIAATPTHVDVYFAHDQADIRIRSAGVDVDPGWLPWLGRVVSYHYCANPRTGEC